MKSKIYLALGLVLSVTACGSPMQYNSAMPYGYGYNNAANSMYMNNTGTYGTGLQTNTQQQGLSQQYAQTYGQTAQSQQNQTQASVQNPIPNQTQALSGTQTPQQQVNTPANVQRTAPQVPPVTQPQVAQPQTRQPAAAPQMSTAKRLATQAMQRFNSLQSFKFVVDAFELNNIKEPSRLSFYMSAQNKQAKIEVFKHSNSLYKGVKMNYQWGQNKIAVRPGGVLGFVKVDTTMDDERLSTPRGYRLDQIDAFAIANRLLGGPHEPKVLGKTNFNGRSIAVLEYTRANDFDNKITRELLGIDLEDHFIRMHEMYEGDKLVFSLKLSNIQFNLPLSAKDMEI